MLELINQGDGWTVTIVGMGAVFVSLILLVIFIRAFAVIIQRVEARRAAQRAPHVSATVPLATPALSTEPTGEIAAAVALALAATERDEEVAAAIALAINSHLYEEGAASPATSVAAQDGRGANLWSMAGRTRLMNSRMGWTTRSRRT